MRIEVAPSIKAWGNKAEELEAFVFYIERDGFMAVFTKPKAFGSGWNSSRLHQFEARAA